jgi:hypothetical protein
MRRERNENNRKSETERDTKPNMVSIIERFTKRGDERIAIDAGPDQSFRLIGSGGTIWGELTGGRTISLPDELESAREITVVPESRIPGALPRGKFDRPGIVNRLDLFDSGGGGGGSGGSGSGSGSGSNGGSNGGQMNLPIPDVGDVPKRLLAVLAVVVVVLVGVMD